MIKILKTFFIFFICLIFLNEGYCQDASKIKDAAKNAKKEVLKIQLEKVGIIYPIENNFGFRVSSNGFGAYYENLKFKTVNNKRFMTVDFYYYIDFKEKQITTFPFPGNNLQNSYHYGKLNDLFGFRFAYGIRKALTDKTEDDEVQISYTLAGGITLGFLKPYYLDISYGKRVFDQGSRNYFYEEQRVEAESFSQTNARIFLTQQIVNLSGDDFAYIKGSSSFGEGFSQLQLIPGLHGRFGFNFDWGTKDIIVKQMEVGIMLDLYNKAMPMYFNNYNSQFNFSVYYSLGIGRRRALHAKSEKREEN